MKSTNCECRVVCEPVICHPSSLVPVTRDRLDYSIESRTRFLQGIASFTTVVLWVIKTYAHDVPVWIFVLDTVCCFIFTLRLGFELLQSSWHVRTCLSWKVWLDAFTIVPLLLQRTDQYGTWLSVAFLRVFRCVTAFDWLKSRGTLDPFMTELGQMAFLAFLKCMSVVVLIAGTMMLLEVLGEISGFEDQLIETNMGDISFLQMCYFAFTTISTVGYGDFSPSTTLSRIFIFAAILGGVSFFSQISVDIYELHLQVSSGMGKYQKSMNKRHVLVCGGAVETGHVVVLREFLRAMTSFSSHDGEDPPEVVLLGRGPCPSDLRSLLDESWARKAGVHYFAGTPLLMKDLIRVQAHTASVTFILADFVSEEPDHEDVENIMRASAV